MSHFYLTNLIIQRQTAARTSQGEGQRLRSLRVINVSSSAYSRGSMEHLDELTSRRRESDEDGSGRMIDIYQSYSDSKLAMMLFTTELNFRHTINNVMCLAAHPGSLKKLYNTYHRTATNISSVCAVNVANIFHFYRPTLSYASELLES